MKEHNPSIRFVHITVPNTAGTTGWRRMINRIFGRTGNSDLENMKRHTFNEMLVEHFSGDAVFDLASIESTRHDGSREAYRVGKETYYSLVPEYASEDGDHLNETGRRVVARALVHALAEIVRGMTRCNS